MIRFRTALPFLLAGFSLIACSGQPAGSTVQTAGAGAPAGAAPRAGDGQCPAGQSGSFTSKVRHVPDEGDPCVNTQGVAPRAVQP